MATNKTKTTDASVPAFIKKVENPERRADALKLIEIYEQVTKFEPKMYGPSIVGFGTYHYKYESGHEGDAPLAAFSPRKNAMVLYIAQYEGSESELEKLGKYKRTKGCIYIKKLADIDVKIFKEMIKKSVKYTKDKYAK